MDIPPAIPTGRQIVESYGDGGFRVSGTRYAGSILVLPAGTCPWPVTAFAQLDLRSFEPVIAAAAEIDVLLLDCGGAFPGHLFPVWLKFQGGNGFATVLGILLAVAWPLGVAACLTWLFTAVLTRDSSFSTLNAAIHAPILALFFAEQEVATLAGFMTVLIFPSHYANIRRLLKGKEPAIGKS